MRCCSPDSADSIMKGVTYFEGLQLSAHISKNNQTSFWGRYVLAANVLKVSWESLVNDCQSKCWTGKHINRAVFIPALGVTFIGLISVPNIPLFPFWTFTLLLICLQESVCMVHKEWGSVSDNRSQYSGILTLSTVSFNHGYPLHSLKTAAGIKCKSAEDGSLTIYCSLSSSSTLFLNKGKTTRYKSCYEQFCK